MSLEPQQFSNLTRCYASLSRNPPYIVIERSGAKTGERKIKERHAPVFYLHVFFDLTVVVVVVVLVFFRDVGGSIHIEVNDDAGVWTGDKNSAGNMVIDNPTINKPLVPQGSSPGQS